MLLLDVVQGHGRDNLQHELEFGDADVVSPRPGDVVRSALAALERPPPATRSVLPAPARPRWARSAADWEKSFSAALKEIGLGGP